MRSLSSWVVLREISLRGNVSRWVPEAYLRVYLRQGLRRIPDIRRNAVHVRAGTAAGQQKMRPSVRDNVGGLPDHLRGCR